jgi:hypothetical protein
MNDFKAPGKASKLLERSSSSTKYLLFSILGLGSRAQWKTGKISKINCASVGAEED